MLKLGKQISLESEQDQVMIYSNKIKCVYVCWNINEKIAFPKHTYYLDKYSASLPIYMSHKQTSANHSVLDWEIQPKRNFKSKKQL